MEEAGLVRRRRDGRDRRRVVVELSGEGKQKYLALFDEAVAVVEEALRPLDEGEQRALAMLLEKIVS